MLLSAFFPLMPCSASIKREIKASTSTYRCEIILASSPTVIRHSDVRVDLIIFLERKRGLLDTGRGRRPDAADWYDSIPIVSMMCYISLYLTRRDNCLRAPQTIAPKTRDATNEKIAVTSLPSVHHTTSFPSTETFPSAGVKMSTPHHQTTISTVSTEKRYTARVAFSS
jgi:hypothetical protein